MNEIIIVTNDKNRFSALERGLCAESDCRIVWTNSVKQAVDRASGTLLDLMIIDEEVDGLSNLEIAHRIVLANAMTNLAVVSSLSEEEFHEDSEGLGILAQLPPVPGEENGSKLLEAMNQIASLKAP